MTEKNYSSIELKNAKNTKFNDNFFQKYKDGNFEVIDNNEQIVLFEINAFNNNDILFKNANGNFTIQYKNNFGTQNNYEDLNLVKLIACYHSMNIKCLIIFEKHQSHLLINFFNYDNHSLILSLNASILEIPNFQSHNNKLLFCYDKTDSGISSHFFIVNELQNSLDLNISFNYISVCPKTPTLPNFFALSEIQMYNDIKINIDEDKPFNKCIMFENVNDVQLTFSNKSKEIIFNSYQKAQSNKSALAFSIFSNNERIREQLCNITYDNVQDTFNVSFEDKCKNTIKFNISATKYENTIDFFNQINQKIVIFEKDNIYINYIYLQDEKNGIDNLEIHGINNIKVRIKNFDKIKSIDVVKPTNKFIVFINKKININNKEIIIEHLSDDFILILSNMSGESSINDEQNFVKFFENNTNISIEEMIPNDFNYYKYSKHFLSLEKTCKEKNQLEIYVKFAILHDINLISNKFIKHIWIKCHNCGYIGDFNKYVCNIFSHLGTVMAFYSAIFFLIAGLETSIFTTLAVWFDSILNGFFIGSKPVKIAFENLNHSMPDNLRLTFANYLQYIYSYLFQYYLALHLALMGISLKRLYSRKKTTE